MTQYSLLVLGAVLWAAVVSLLAGYGLWLARLPRRATLLGPSAEEGWPDLEIVLPVRDEAGWIAEKLEELAALAYPGRVRRIWVVDGGSLDGTAAAVADWIEGDPRFRLVRLRTGNKVAQLNAALPHVRSAWVVVTDADARSPASVLTEMMALARNDRTLGAIGTAVLPQGAHSLERLHWALSNRLRRAESRRGSASIVTGPCYAFRRQVLGRFPSDVVADDVHVALAASVAGYCVALCDADTRELRAPRTLVQFWTHKRRKADAYLRESFRFLPRRGAMPGPARTIFLWRAVQMIIGPVLFLLGAAALAAGLVSLGTPGWLVLGGLAAAASVGPARPVVGLVAWGACLAAVLAVALASFPFSRQTAAYPKIVPQGGGGMS